MKIKDADYEILKAFYMKVDYPAARMSYIKDGLSIKRYCWDAISVAGGIPFVCDTLYEYLNDDHIDTALRNIYKETASI